MTPHVNNLPLATATAFTVVVDVKAYLITNWHVLSGRNPVTGQPKSPTGATPDSLEVAHYTRDQERNALTWLLLESPLVDDDGRSLWLEHPTHGRNVDVGALPISGTFDILLRTYELDPDPAAPLPLVGDFVNIIGFPFGKTSGGRLGIWTKGSVASEPDVDLDDLPLFYIDARTREGQSGSPVITYSRIHGDGASPNEEHASLVGIYSGRINEESDLGHVWKTGVIREIVEGGVRGDGGLVPSHNPNRH